MYNNKCVKYWELGHYCLFGLFYKLPYNNRVGFSALALYAQVAVRYKGYYIVGTYVYISKDFFYDRPRPNGVFGPSKRSQALIFTYNTNFFK